MESPMNFKRRRLNESHNTLRKPFVSPLKTPKQARAPLQQNNNAANLLYQPSVLAHTIKPTPSSTTTAPTTSRLSNFTPAKPTPLCRQPNLTSTSKQNPSSELAAQKAVTSLETQIRQIRSEICNLEQAAQLLSSTSNAHLEELAQKWKLASQAAADDLFESTKERLDRMGGVAAWNESEKRKYEWSDGLDTSGKGRDADCEFDSEGEELSEEEQERRRSKKRRARKDMEDAAAEREESVQDRLEIDNVEESETFTIDMMLRSLNIELDVIGYDKVAERWIA